MRVYSNFLAAQTAEDLMSRDVVAVPRNMSARAAVDLLTRARIGGAPVVDDDGRCVGVVSLSDLARDPRRPGEARPVPGCVCSEWQVVSTTDAPRDAVCCHMTADPVTVPPFATVGEMARKMVNAHIHRLIVVDEENRPVGVVSSTDILAALARAGE
ncbi:MAG TPA: CBS domain-containing protein [Gemmataceae bacterium]|nr:CBS domain-containing protein [Gemmataceae bacterium]